jgi:AraC-like DNA-binding protein
LPAARLLSLGRPVLTERLAGPAFRYAKPFDNPVKTRPAARRAQKFPLAAAAQIAFDLGFRDPAYFSRVFKRLTGLTPRRYRLRSRGGA